MVLTFTKFEVSNFIRDAFFSFFLCGTLAGTWRGEGKMYVEPLSGQAQGSELSALNRPLAGQTISGRCFFFFFSLNFFFILLSLQRRNL